MRLSWPPKDTDEVLDYMVDWSDRLDSDAIASSAWTVPSGITQNSNEFDASGGTTTIWLSGGTTGETYELVNRITTAAGRTMDQTIRLKIADK